MFKNGQCNYAASVVALEIEDDKIVFHLLLLPTQRMCLWMNLPFILRFSTYAKYVFQFLYIFLTKLIVYNIYTTSRFECEEVFFRNPLAVKKDEEREFWSKRDSTEYVDYPKAKRVLFPELRSSTRSISIRLPESLIEKLKVLANERDVPYQSLMKIFLAEKVGELSTK